MTKSKTESLLEEYLHVLGELRIQLEDLEEQEIFLLQTIEKLKEKIEYETQVPRQKD